MLPRDVDVKDITQKMFPFGATVPDASPNLPRRRVADCYDHMETRPQSHRKQRGKTAGRDFGQTTFFQDTRTIVMQGSKPNGAFQSL